MATHTGPLWSYLNTPRMRWKMPFFLGGSCLPGVTAGVEAVGGGAAPVCRAARRTAGSGAATPSPPDPVKLGAALAGAGGVAGLGAVSQPETVVIPRRPP